MTEFVKVGPKVSLRPIEEADFPLVVEWRNKDRIRNNHVYRKDFTVEGMKTWKETMLDTGKVVQLVICENGRDNRPIGCLHLRDINREEDSAEYGIFIGEEDALGLGYGSEAAVLATEYARDELGLKKLILRAFAFNTVAIRSYQHAGFAKTADLPQVECSDGQKDDMILMEKTLTD
ncbi:GNAT family N-acetyltransferase [Butyrivibrio sp. FCS014]|uniref:GNAT family N-acetyltransferase n=1 Tax=Butyrivibrio sp. FCS014 TaxID=1408304 RepID=UPI0004652999|nr:GNAT family N-acetyltransferase [Butyrivibrio sp. FCS014]